MSNDNDELVRRLQQFVCAQTAYSYGSVFGCLVCLIIYLYVVLISKGIQGACMGW